MEYEIKVKELNHPQGTRLQVADLPVDLVVGETVKVDADAAEAFKAARGETVLEVLKRDPQFDVSTSGKKGGD